MKGETILRRNIFTIIISFISMFALVYYTLKFYYIMNVVSFVWWILTVLIFITIVVLLITSTIRLSKIESKISEMTDMIKDFRVVNERHHYDEMAEINNNLECILDLDRK